MRSILNILLPVTFLLFAVGCADDFLETEPSEFVSGEQLQNAPDAVFSLLDGAYNFMVKYNTQDNSGTVHDDFGQKSIDLGVDLMTEDMVFPQPAYGWFQDDYRFDNRNAEYRRTKMVWNYYYKLIFASNQVLDILGEELADEKSENYAGQALAMRAYSHYYLVRLFQFTYNGHEYEKGVPVKVSLTEKNQSRDSVITVYEQIEEDLLLAIDLLEGKAQPSKREINYYVACGILADVYLTMENYTEAARYANLARSGYSLMSDEEWLSGFQDVTNQEWMWGYDHNINSATTFASFFSMMDPVKYGYAGIGDYKSISSTLYDQISDSDIRKMAFVGAEVDTVIEGQDTTLLEPYTIKKFRDTSPELTYTGDYVFMRAAEMYFIEAEALARDGRESDAKQVLYDIVSERDDSYALSGNSGQALLDEIFLHKRIELLGEGRTFFDLKRLKKDVDRTNIPNHTSLTNEVIPWNDKRFLYQIPEAEIDPNLGMGPEDQNP